MKNVRKQFMISCLLWAFMSVSVLIMPFAGNDDNYALTPLGYAVGILFWLGLAGGTVSYVLLILKNKEYLAKNIPTSKIPVGLHFFRNKTAMVTDIILVISIVQVVLGATLLGFPEFINIMGLFLLVTAGYSHFLFNGNVFTYIISPERTKKGKRREKNAKKEDVN